MIMENDSYNKLCADIDSATSTLDRLLALKHVVDFVRINRIVADNKSASMPFNILHARTMLISLSDLVDSYRRLMCLGLVGEASQLVSLILMTRYTLLDNIACLEDYCNVHTEWDKEMMQVLDRVRTGDLASNLCALMEAPVVLVMDMLGKPIGSEFMETAKRVLPENIYNAYYTIYGVVSKDPCFPYSLMQRTMTEVVIHCSDSINELLRFFGLPVTD